MYYRVQQEEGSYAGYQLAYEVKKLLYAFYLTLITISPRFCPACFCVLCYYDYYLFSESIVCDLFIFFTLNC